MFLQIKCSQQNDLLIPLNKSHRSVCIEIQTGVVHAVVLGVCQFVNTHIYPLHKGILTIAISEKTARAAVSPDLRRVNENTILYPYI